MKSTARANTNIALIKYWGKRDEELFLPMNSSLSITLDKFYTITTVEFLDNLKEDTLILNKEIASKKDLAKCSNFLDIIRITYGVNKFASIESMNYVPTAAGFASSASGFAALAAAATKALNLDISMEELSAIARRGSGSALRSIYGGFVEWDMGSKADGSDSIARQIISEKEWKLSILSVLVDTGKKKVSSREGMRRTVETSPFYKGWLETAASDLLIAKQAIEDRNFIELGEVMESNALKMHGTMLAAMPPIVYFESGTIEVFHKVYELRNSGLPAYFTIDAGANVKVLCLPDHEMIISKALRDIKAVLDVISCSPGEGISYL